MKNKIIIYSGEYCPNCKMIKSFMDNQGIQYEERNIENEEYKKELEKRGFKSIPVLVTNGEYHLVDRNNFIGVLKNFF